MSDIYDCLENVSELCNVRAVSASERVFTDDDDTLCTTQQGIAWCRSPINARRQHRRQLSGLLQLKKVKVARTRLPSVGFRS